MRTFDPHLFRRGVVDPISLGVLGLIVTSIVIGTIAVIRTASFDIRQRAQTYPTRYSCQTGSCVSDPNGEFLSIGECDDVCTPPPPPSPSPKLPNGNSCSSSNQCSSNFCGNGICQNPVTCPNTCQNGCYANTNTCLPYCDQTTCPLGCVFDTSVGGQCRTSTDQCVAQGANCDPSTNISELKCCGDLYCQVSSSGATCIADVAQIQCPASCPQSVGCVSGTTTCKAYCDTNKCSNGCSQENSSGGICNPPELPPVESGASCYYGAGTCPSNRAPATGCPLECPTNTGIAACCGDIISSKATICTQNEVQCANSSAIQVCNSSGTAWTVQNCASGLACEGNKCVTPTQIGDSCSQPHGQPVRDNLYCCDFKAKDGQCVAPIDTGDETPLIDGTWCYYTAFGTGSCNNCVNGSHPENGRDICGPAEEPEPVPYIPPTTSTDPLESIVSAIIANDPAYYQEQLTKSLQAGQITVQCQGDVVCNYLVTNALANLENDPYVFGQSNLNRFGAAVGLGGPTGAAIGAAGIGIYATGGQILQYGPQIVAAGTGLAVGGQQLLQNASNFFTQLGQSVATSISTNPQAQRFLAQFEECLGQPACNVLLQLSDLDTVVPLANAGLRNPYLLVGQSTQIISAPSNVLGRGYDNPEELIFNSLIVPAGPRPITNRITQAVGGDPQVDFRGGLERGVLQVLDEYQYGEEVLTVGGIQELNQRRLNVYAQSGGTANLRDIEILELGVCFERNTSLCQGLRQAGYEAYTVGVDIGATRQPHALVYVLERNAAGSVIERYVADAFAPEPNNPAQIIGFVGTEAEALIPYGYLSGFNGSLDPIQIYPQPNSNYVQ